MKVTTATDLRNNFKEQADKVINDSEPLIVHRKGAEDMVLMAKSEFDSWKETMYLLSTKNNRKNLLNSIKDYESGKDKGVKIQVDDLWK